MNTMEIVRAHKYRIYPNEKQRILIDKTIGCSRFVYNQLLEENISHYAEHKESSKKTSAGLKKDFEWLKEVDSQALTQSHNDLAGAFSKFFDKKAGFPRFKKKGQNDTYRSARVKNNIRIEDSKLRMPKVGFLKIKMERPIPSNATINNVTITKTSTNKYFASVNFSREINVTPVKPKAVIGLDFALAELYVDSNGNKGNNPKFYRKYERKLATAQRKLSKMQKYSNNYKKQQQIIAKIHEDIANKRKDFLHKTSRKIANSYDVVGVEDLNLKAMSKLFGKSVYDAGWGMFVKMLEYKLEELGKYLVKADKFFPSTKQCSSCKNKKDFVLLSERWYSCDVCGHEQDRDVNASINLRNYAIDKLELQLE